MTTTTENPTRPTAAYCREQAAASRQRSAESWDRSDTDGFLSQWASDTTASEWDLKAELAEDGWTAEFVALFDLDGNMIPAKEINGTYGPVWMLLDEHGRKRGWFNMSGAQKAATRRANNAKKGVYVGLVRVPAHVAMTGGSGTGLGGCMSVRPSIFPDDRNYASDPTVQVVDNGQA
jgi:hypothetical protein